MKLVVDTLTPAQARDLAAALLEAAANAEPEPEREPPLPAERIYKNDATNEASVPLSIRPPLSVANRFIAYCKAERLTYAEGLAELMKGRKL